MSPQAPMIRAMMAAVSAITHNPDIKRFYDRLVAAGKCAKVALTAVIRKLLVLANTLIAQDRTWTHERPSLSSFAEPLSS